MFSKSGLSVLHFLSLASLTTRVVVFDWLKPPIYFMFSVTQSVSKNVGSSAPTPIVFEYFEGVLISWFR